ncbi:HEPN domain-containing protein [Mesorhizobium sp. WSM4906]|uniref:HEPN domain-containing protein n=1 Tax=Mesorhizobium sp. WSM4906 TaxID=3038546 RepID=UPI0024164E62|nr:HEPN domain-containing protein [Mesorhizobium sp. WSM4906]WFP76996.1 HEPN domain-containing protein [Mesorhizobium sp. WSM4906]
MTRDEWRRKSRTFAQSARLLLNGAEYDTAYYLSGVAVECALKAKIASAFRANDLPDKNFVHQIYSNGHKLSELVKLGQLATALTAEEQASAAFRAYWNTVKAWDVDSRYKTWTPAEAASMVTAVTNRGTGVLAWIRRHW